MPGALRLIRLSISILAGLSPWSIGGTGEAIASRFVVAGLKQPGLDEYWMPQASR
jgi:hypothetical protein